MPLNNLWRRHLLLDAPIPLRCPVRILQGMAIGTVPASRSVVAWPLPR